MQANHPSELKKKQFSWIIVVVAVLLAGALALYIGLMRTQPARVVARGKIPPMPPSPSMESPAGTSATSEAAPPNDAGRRESEYGAQSQGDLESRLAASVADGPQENAPGMKSETATPPPEGSNAGTGKETMEDSEQTGSSDGQAPAAGSDGNQPIITVGEEPQAATLAAPDSAPPADSTAPPSSDLSATEAAPAQTALAPSAPETVAPYTIQVGAYRTKSNADRQIVQLREKGVDAYLYQQNDKDQHAWYFVRFGRFEHFDSAGQALTAFKDREHADGTIVRSNSN
jgi:cell division protein FtsN